MREENGARKYCFTIRSSSSLRLNTIICVCVSPLVRPPATPSRRGDPRPTSWFHPKRTMAQVIVVQKQVAVPAQQVTETGTHT